MTEQAVPLLKFAGDKAILCEAGSNAIAALPGRIYPVILLGDGRAGKSYLGNRLMNNSAFTHSASAHSVTEGADLAIADLRELIKGMPNPPSIPALAESDEPLHMVVLDCEGGNNAMAVIRTLVNVFGMIIGTEVMFVTGSSLSESALLSLEGMIAARQLIKFDQDVPDQRLVFVVNKNTLDYDANALEVALTKPQGDANRQATRDLVKNTFLQRSFLTVPDMEEPEFESSIGAYREQIFKDARPLKMAGVEMTGTTLVEVLKMVVDQMADMNEVNMPSMSRAIILDGFLKPLEEDTVREAEDQIEKLGTEYIPDLDVTKMQTDLIATFDRRASRVNDTFKHEVRRRLSEKLDLALDTLNVKNRALGQHTAAAETETREQLGKIDKSPVGGHSFLRFVRLSRQECTIELRNVLRRKNGEADYGEWRSSGPPRFNIIEDQFIGLDENVPCAQGKLFKRSPSMWAGMCGKSYQARRITVRDGVLMWWDEKNIAEPTGNMKETDRRKEETKRMSGCVNFWLNTAKVKKVDKTTFVVKPADGTCWDDTTNFTGSSSREFVFKVGSRRIFGKHYMSVKSWIQLIKANIMFAQSASKQLGKGRVRDEIGNRMPTLSEALWQPNDEY